MTLDAMYEAWAERDLSAPEMRRVFGFARRRGNLRLMSSVLHHYKCPEDLLVEAGSSQDDGVLHLWLTARSVTREERTAKLAELPVERVRSILRRKIHLSEEEMRLLWRRRDTELRLAVLPHVSWSSRVPEGWRTWLLKVLPTLGERSQDVVKDLAEATYEWMWDTARQSSDLQILSWTLAGMQERYRQEWYVRHFLSEVERVLEEGITTEQAHAVSVTLSLLLDDRRGARKAVAGSDEAEIALLLLRSPALSVTDQALLKVSLDIQDAAKAKTREELLEEVLAGTLSDEAIASAQATQGDVLSDELWLAVAGHPQLRAEAAWSLLREIRHAREELAAATKVLVGGRKPRWRREVGAAAWACRTDVHTLRTFLQALPFDDQYHIVGCWAKEGELDRILEVRVASTAALSAFPVSRLSRTSAQSKRELMQHAHSKLREDDAAWEIFEGLLWEYTGTFGELLDASVNLAK